MLAEQCPKVSPRLTKVVSDVYMKRTFISLCYTIKRDTKRNRLTPALRQTISDARLLFTRKYHIFTNNFRLFL